MHRRHVAARKIDATNLTDGFYQAHSAVNQDVSMDIKTANPLPTTRRHDEDCTCVACETNRCFHEMLRGSPSEALNRSSAFSSPGEEKSKTYCVVRDVDSCDNDEMRPEGSSDQALVRDGTDRALWAARPGSGGDFRAQQQPLVAKAAVGNERSTLCTGYRGLATSQATSKLEWRSQVCRPIRCMRPVVREVPLQTSTCESLSSPYRTSSPMPSRPIDKFNFAEQPLNCSEARPAARGSSPCASRGSLHSLGTPSAKASITSGDPLSQTHMQPAGGISQMEFGWASNSRY